ncbi:MAG: GMC family oxidoreductase N-terminal domain-containing protein [Gemmatimonadaceae bacterium]|nr:GMC family oxidoreductase N-terminal domain-containing protein [Gemmatimonadaceae bacterium]
MTPLPPRHRAVLLAAARAVAPHAFSDAARGERLAVALVARVERFPAAKRAQLAPALTLLASPLAGLLAGGLPSAFDRLNSDRAAQAITQWSRSPLAPLRALAQAVRRLVLFVEYAQDDAQREIGYLPPFHLRVRGLPWEGAPDGVDRDDEPIARGAARPPTLARLPITTALPARSEVVIIGSGAGGAAAACRLAEAGHEVVILEAAPHRQGTDFDKNEARGIESLYADAGLRATDDGAVAIFQGTTVGGGTTVNWMIMLRTPEHVLEEWTREHGTEGMRAAELAPVFDEIERDLHATTVPDDAHSANNRILIDGSRVLGWRCESARINSRHCIRAGGCGLGCRDDAKQGALQTYLPRAIAAGAQLVAGAAVQRVDMVERGGAFPLKRCTVRLASGETRTIEAPVVLFAGGAIETPALLQRSALGNAAVGRWLRLHPTSSVMALYDREIHGATGIPLTAMCDEFIQRDARGYGFWIECPPLQPGLAAIALPGLGDAHRRMMLQHSHIGSLVTLVRDGAAGSGSDGEVRARRDGGISIQYRLSAADAEHLNAAMHAAGRIHFAAGAREVRSLHTTPVVATHPDALAPILTQRYRPNSLPVFSAHVNGTVRLGGNASTSACTPDGELRGAPGCFVVDGSLLPTSLGVNPQETIFALATVVARRVSSRRRSG